MGVTGDVRIRLIRNVCTSGRCDRLGSTGSSGSALGMAGFVRGSLHSFLFV